MAADDYGPNGNGIYSASGASDDGADLTEIAAYAGQVGNRRVGTTAQRNAALTELIGPGTPGVWEGLEWWDTTDRNRYVLVSGAWMRPALHRGGVFYDVIAADGTTQIQHGLGVTPTDVQVTPMNHPSDDSISKYFSPVLFNPATSTRFTVRLLDRRSNDWASGQQRYRFQWHAFAAAQ